MMNFGFTGCHSSVPSMQRMAVYLNEALAELETALLPAPPAKPTVRRRAAAPRKAPAAASGGRARA